MDLISAAAISLIVDSEIGSKDAYIKRYQHPIWPGGMSGVTIGIGYDVGAGAVNKQQLHNDWSGHIPDNMIVALERCISVLGPRAQPLATSLYSLVTVPWDAAMAVFQNTDIPRWYGRCKNALPNFESLPPDCKGALLSLAYNRGASFDAMDDRHSEMRQIKSFMISKQFNRIPAEFRAMKRLWTSSALRGVGIRREHEAQLFEHGLGVSVGTFVPPAPTPTATSGGQTPPPAGPNIPMS